MDTITMMRHLEAGQQKYQARICARLIKLYDRAYQKAYDSKQYRAKDRVTDDDIETHLQTELEKLFFHKRISLDNNGHMKIVDALTKRINENTAKIDCLNKLVMSSIESESNKKNQKKANPNVIKIDRLDSENDKLTFLRAIINEQIAPNINQKIIIKLKNICFEYQQYLFKKIQPDSFAQLDETIAVDEDLSDKIKENFSKKQLKIFEKYHAVVKLQKILHNKQTVETDKIKLFSEKLQESAQQLVKHRSSKTYKFFVGLGVVLTGIMPGVIALSVHSKHKNNSFAFWRSTGKSISQKLEDVTYTSKKQTNSPTTIKSSLINACRTVSSCLSQLRDKFNVGIWPETYRKEKKPNLSLKRKQNAISSSDQFDDEQWFESHCNNNGIASGEIITSPKGHKYTMI